MTSDILKRAAEAVEGVTPGPWTVWEEKTATADDAKAELASQVDDTDGFCGAVFMLNAFGKCPALTGCGPTSKANAHFIAAARTLIPDMAAAIAERDEQIERLTAEQDALTVKLDAVTYGDWSTARLVRFENGQFDFSGGPVAYIAEYLAQVMEADNGYHNNVEVRVNHPKAGQMFLTLQRVVGKTPAEQRKEANARAEAAEALLAAATGMVSIVEGIDGVMNHGTWRDERGMRLKDTPEWVSLYIAHAALGEKP